MHEHARTWQIGCTRGLQRLPAQCVWGMSSDWLVDAQRFGVNPSGKWGGSAELCRRWEPDDWSSSQETGCGGVLPRCATADPKNLCPATTLGIATGIVTRWYFLRCSTPSSFTRGDDENRSRNNKTLVLSEGFYPRWIHQGRYLVATTICAILQLRSGPERQFRSLLFQAGLSAT